MLAAGSGDYVCVFDAYGNLKWKYKANDYVHSVAWSNSGLLAAAGYGGLFFTTGFVDEFVLYGPCVVHVDDFIDFGNNTRLLFKGWSDGVKNSTRTLPSNEEYHLTPIYIKQYYVSVVGGSGSGWYDVGSTAFISAEQYVDFGNNTRLVFDGWSNGVKNLSISIRVDGPVKLYVLWRKQYFVSVVGGSGSGWYDVGSTAFISAVERFSGFPFDRVFDRWVDEHGYTMSTHNTYSFTVDKPIKLYAKYRYELNMMVCLFFLIPLVILLMLLRRTRKNREVSILKELLES